MEITYAHSTDILIPLFVVIVVMPITIKLFNVFNLKEHFKLFFGIFILVLVVYLGFLVLLPSPNNFYLSEIKRLTEHSALMFLVTSAGLGIKHYLLKKKD